MRKVLIFVILVILLATPVTAMDFSAPTAPDSAAEYLPREADSFGEGLWNVICSASEVLAPSLTEAVRCCLRCLGAMVLTALVGLMTTGTAKSAVELAGVAAVGAVLLKPTTSLIALGVKTVTELGEYGRLLLPVMASSLAARGGPSTATALYMGTAVFDTILSRVMTAVLIPAIWAVITLSVAHAAAGERMLGKLRDLVKRVSEWTLKLGLYIFTGYMAITGTVSGTTDATAGKAARLAISGAVPVVGGILADASDTVLLSASALGSGAGIWGIMTVIALFCAPVLRIGCQYLILKLTALLGDALGAGRSAMLAGELAGALGLLMAMVSTQTVLLLVSTFCFLKGVSI